MDSESQTNQQTQHQESPKIENKTLESPQQNNKEEGDLTEQINKLKINEQEKDNKAKPSEDAKSEDNIASRKIKGDPYHDSSESDTETPSVDSKGQLTIDGKVYNAKESPNIFFYSNAMKSKPYGTYIKVMHQRWYRGFIFSFE